ncbi:MAG TPA: decaprenyl-phosphate phosphoribosyltransferase [bacterium]|nr:decaprenyl-phosphate phosphoribosyltransferase [bacterium]HPN43843.1 decaprenyl-phosphate phosphoribosyltransferase [bacterium]
MLKNIIIALRPKQWLKNVLVFAGAIFAEDLFVPHLLQYSVFAFIIFCMISGSTYLINDVMDRDKDALHPRKKFRPIASGKISVKTALLLAVVLIFMSLYSSFTLNWHFGVIIACYFITTLLYSLYFKHVIILDVIIIASGFMFRAIGGAFVINEQVSSWLIICTMFLALFFALNKRRAEIIALGDNAGNVRQTLLNYDLHYLDMMINIVTAACLMAYALYTLDPGTVAKFGTRNLVMTLPFVIYGLFRYLYLAYHLNLGETPETTLIKDKPILFCVFLYLVTVVIIIY